MESTATVTAVGETLQTTVLTSGTILGSWDDSCIRVIPIYNNLYAEETVVEFPGDVIFTTNISTINQNEPQAPDDSTDISKVSEQPIKVSTKKQRRNKNEKYSKSLQKNKDHGDNVKILGPDCWCPAKCFERVGMETINKIFRDFWALSDYNSQNAYLFGLITMAAVKRRYTKAEISRRNFTVTYSVKRRGENITVCKKAFLNIHGLHCNRGRINNLVAKMKGGQSVPSPDRRGRHGNRANAYSADSIHHVRQQLLLYSRKGSKILEQSYRKCYQSYVDDYCVQNDLRPVSFDKYRNVAWTERYRPGPRQSSAVKAVKKKKTTTNVASQTGDE